jgi:hypothetical protein
VDDVARGGGLLLRVAEGALALGVGLTLTSCRPPPLAGVGRATETPSLGAAAPDVDAGPPSALSSDYKTRLVRVGPDSFVSWGHEGGRYAGMVYVTRGTEGALKPAGKEAPVGAEVVMAYTDRVSHKPGPTFFMQRTETGWRYGVAESPSATPADLALCARCHAEAPHGELFALPE